MGIKFGDWFLLTDLISGMMLGIEFVDKGVCLDLVILRLIIIKGDSSFLEDFL